MRYLDKIIKENADGNNYESGYRVEVSKSEVYYLIRALEIASHEEMSEPFSSKNKELIQKLENIRICADKGLINEDL